MPLILVSQVAVDLPFEWLLSGPAFSMEPEHSPLQKTGLGLGPGTIALRSSRVGLSLAAAMNPPPNLRCQLCEPGGGAAQPSGIQRSWAPRRRLLSAVRFVVRTLAPSTQPLAPEPCCGSHSSSGNTPMAERGELDLTGAKQNTGVWLVKVPKYLSQQWAKAPGRGEVGKLRIAKNQGRTEVSFTLNEDLANIHDIGGKPASVSAPREHPFVLQSVGGQTLTVFTESSSDKLSLEGIVVQRAECRPAASENYMRLKRLQAERSQTALKRQGREA
ncbi:General transcription factor IIF subunit 2 [Myotis davidii]|uniref:General transcription factor IIF subunit 2 n=1 Tax=Myotis davidii TaxID=225400 RepID=L5MA44_MYODS|nr:General transcription factor IIF subunit 2 [Myotis davidii]